MAGLRAEHVLGSDRWRLLEPLTCRGITAPAGFETDLMSIPGPLRGIWPRRDRYAEGAVIHDWLYQTAELERSQADRILAEAMVEQGSRASTAFVVYLALRALGWIRWNQIRRADLLE